MRTRFLVILFLPFLACGDDDPGAPGSGQVPYEIKYETACGLCAGGHHGGDNRAVGGPRNVGTGCSVLVDENITLDTFALYFAHRFDFVENATNTGHAVTMRLTVRDASGVAIKTVDTEVPNTFEGGWVEWTGIDINVDAGTTIIFTSNLLGAYDTNEVWSTCRADENAGYANGVRYTKQGTDDASMDEWSGWNVHVWDAWFWLKGRER